MTKLTQVLLHLRDLGTIKLMSKHEFCLHFLDRELVVPEWVLPIGDLFKSSGILSATSYVHI